MLTSTGRRIDTLLTQRPKTAAAVAFFLLIAGPIGLAILVVAALSLLWHRLSS